MMTVLRLLMLVIAAVMAAGLFSAFRQAPETGPAAALEMRDIELPIQPKKQAELPKEEKPGPLPAKPRPSPTVKTPEPVKAPASPVLPPLSPEPPIAAIPVEPVLPLSSFPLVMPLPPEQLSDQEFYSRFSGAIVQIFCQSQTELFSASGVIVNERGLVLTNAHVAEIVEKVGGKNCQARHGNPADPFAKIEIVYIASTTPKISGTSKPGVPGVSQRDFAFLRITEARESFSYAAMDTVLVPRGETLLTLGYPSEFLQGISTSRNSNLVFSTLSVAGYADVDGNLDTAEGYVFKGGIILQQGSSGTALFNRSGKIVGLIFATTKGQTTADRDGLALMTPYIDKILKTETGEGLMEFIANH